MDYFFPTEIIDAIVGACDHETLFTFTLVSKRYSQLFIYGNEPMVRDYKNYFYVQLYGEYFPRAAIGQRILCLNNPSYIIYMKAKCRHKFTKIPSDEDMIKFVPFNHPKFNKFLSEDERFLLTNHQDIYSFASLEDAKTCHQILKDKFIETHDYSYYLAQNIDDEAFKYSSEIYYDDDCPGFYYRNTLINKQRLEWLLERMRVMRKDGKILYF